MANILRRKPFIAVGTGEAGLGETGAMLPFCTSIALGNERTLRLT